MTNLKLSAYVLTHNSNEFIHGCLESLRWVDELIVVDDFSDDQTREIAATYGAKVLSRRMDSFSSQRNFAVANCTHEWVLAVDADEEISVELKEEILRTLSTPTNIAGFKIPRKNYFLNQWMHSIYPDYGVRLFKKAGAVYSGQVHEKLKIQGEIGYLKKPLIHYAYRSVEDVIAKMNRYTTIHAKELYERGKRANVFDITVRPLVKFCKRYFLKRGFLDGIPGLIIIVLTTYYTFVKYAKLITLEKVERLKNKQI